MGSITPFVVIPAFMALIGERFIDAEEAMLARAALLEPVERAFRR